MTAHHASRGSIAFVCGARTLHIAPACLPACMNAGCTRWYADRITVVTLLAFDSTAQRAIDEKKHMRTKSDNISVLAKKLWASLEESAMTDEYCQCIGRKYTRAGDSAHSRTSEPWRWVHSVDGVCLQADIIINRKLPVYTVSGSSPSFNRYRSMTWEETSEAVGTK